MNDVESSDSFKSLPFHCMKEIVARVPTSESFKAFIVWLSKNEVTKDERNEIVDNFIFEDFTVEELMISVRDSGLYPDSKIDKRVLEIVKEKDLKIEELNSKIKQLDLIS